MAKHVALGNSSGKDGTSSSIFPMAPDDGIARQKHNMYLDAPKSILLANS